MNNNLYSDYARNPISLTENELKYFNDTVKQIIETLHINTNVVNIMNYDFDQYTDKHKNSLGVCGTQDFIHYDITIDNYFIHECYESITNSHYFKIEPQTLQYVICHEIAHCYQWRHCKKHTSITNELLERVS
jgi:hypothetical protein